MSSPIERRRLLLGGAALAILLGNPYQPLFRRWTHRLLAWSVIGLGAGMDLRVVLKAGLHGLGYTVVSISATLALGLRLTPTSPSTPNRKMLDVYGNFQNSVSPRLPMKKFEKRMIESSI